MSVSLVADTAHKMGVVACTSYVIGNIIGSGIFVTANSVAEQAGSVGLTLVLWTVCALLSFLGAIVYVELATAITEPGADYAYAMHVGWNAMAFTFMIISVFITFPASAAVQSVTFGKYVKQLFGAPISPESHSIFGHFDYVEFLLAISLLAATTALNFFSLDKFAARFQVVVTICKMGAICLIIGIGGYFMIFKGEFVLALGDTQNFVDPFKGSSWDVGKITMAIYGGLWSYAGWDILNYGTPEIHNPRRTMPLSLFLGLFVVCTAYLLVNTAFFTVLSIDEVKASQAIGSDFADRTLGGTLASIIPAMIAILVMGTLNSNIFCGSRVMQAAAREGHLPAFISGLNPGSGSPRPAILIQSIIGGLMCLIPPDQLVNAVTFVIWAQKAVTAAALLWIRYRRVPVRPDAIRVPIVLTWLLFISSLALVIIPFVDDIRITLVGCGVIVISLVFYFAAIRFGVCGCGGLYHRASDLFSTVTKKVLCVELDLKPASTREEREELNKGRTKSEEDEEYRPTRL